MQPNPSSLTEPRQISAFSNARADTSYDKLVGVPRIVSIIQSSEKVKELTTAFRAIVLGQEAKRFADESFLCVTWSGSAAGLETLPIHSGLMCAHVSGLSSERLATLWPQLESDEFTHVLYVDQSGTGLIIVVRIDYQQPGDLLAFARQLSDYYHNVYGIQTVGTVSDDNEPELDPDSMKPDWRCPVTHCAEVIYVPESQILPLLPEYDSSVAQEIDKLPDGQPKSIQTANSLLAEVKIERQQAQQIGLAQSEINGPGPNKSSIKEEGDSSFVNAPKQIGLLTIRTANGWVEDAKLRPRMLLDELWLEGELCILFAESNQGKSIAAVQAGDSISRGKAIPGFRLEAGPQIVLYCDFELSSKQFEGRYSEDFTNHYKWHNNFWRIEINTDADVPNGVSFEDYLKAIDESGAKVLIIDNLTYLRTDTESAKDAGPLMNYLKLLKQKHGLSLLILAHTPKRDASRPLTRNDLQGSSRLNQFADSMFAIGSSARDSQLKYIKQVKVRSTAYRYDSDNVVVCQIVKQNSFLMFEQMSYSTEQEHLRVPTEKDTANLPEQILALYKAGKTQQQIALDLGISQPKVSRTLAKLATDK